MKRRGAFGIYEKIVQEMATCLWSYAVLMHEHVAEKGFMAVKILTVDPRWCDPVRLAFMREYLAEGFELVIPDSFDLDTLRREAKTASALLTGQDPITAEMMQAAPALRVVGKIGTGVDSIDVEAATAAGLPVAHSPGWMRATPVAEHACTLMLMLARRPWLWSGGGSTPLHLPLEGSTLGIVGLGAIGQRLARRAASFDMTVLAYTRTRGKFQPEGFAVEEVNTLADLLPRSDFVLTLPLTPDTQIDRCPGTGVHAPDINADQRVERPTRGHQA